MKRFLLTAAALLIFTSAALADDSTTEYAVSCFAVTHVLIVHEGFDAADPTIKADWSLWKVIANDDMNRANRYISSVESDLSSDPDGLKLAALYTLHYDFCHPMAEDVRSELR